CDGTADDACPGRCQPDCTCAPAPVCGDNAVNQASEQCDGTADSACPGRCRADCTCAPAPVCGDNVVNQAREACDGADDSARRGRCGGTARESGRPDRATGRRTAPAPGAAGPTAPAPRRPSAATTW